MSMPYTMIEVPFGSTEGGQPIQYRKFKEYPDGRKIIATSEELQVWEYVQELERIRDLPTEDVSYNDVPVKKSKR